MRNGFILPLGLQPRIEALARDFLQPPGLPWIDFSQPAGEPALAEPNSMSWQVFRNPISLFIGGIAAVLLEFGEPRVRTGVWEHSSFQGNAVARLQRTGLAAMVTVYGARSVAESMIAGVRQSHEKVAGTTPRGEPYRANDPELLDWVQATAAFGFLEAYCSYVAPLSLRRRDLFYAEGEPAGRLYGAVGAPTSTAEMNAILRRMRPRLEPSPIVFEFLKIMKSAPLLPQAFAPVQAMLIRAGVEIVPDWVRTILGLGAEWRLRPWETSLVKAAATLAGNYRIDSGPSAQACVRLGLPPDYLHRNKGESRD